MSDFDWRQSKIVIGGAVLIVLLVVFWGYDSYRQSLQRMDRKIASVRNEMKQLDGLFKEYRQLEGVLQGLGPISRDDGTNLIATVEDAAQKARAKSSLLYVRPQPDRVREEYVEEAVDIRLDQLQLQQLVAMLYQFEKRSAQLKVKHLRVRTRFDNPDSIDAVMTLSRIKEKI